MTTIIRNDLLISDSFALADATQIAAGVKITVLPGATFDLKGFTLLNYGTISLEGDATKFAVIRNGTYSTDSTTGTLRSNYGNLKQLVVDGFFSNGYLELNNSLVENSQIDGLQSNLINKSIFVSSPLKIGIESATIDQVTFSESPLSLHAWTSTVYSTRLVTISNSNFLGSTPLIYLDPFFAGPGFSHSLKITNSYIKIPAGNNFESMVYDADDDLKVTTDIDVSAFTSLPIKTSSAGFSVGAYSIPITDLQTPQALNNTSPTGLVSITGELKKGGLLTATNTLADKDGLGSISYQWKVNDINVDGAKSSTFILEKSHVGKTISVVATYVDNGGFIERVSSSATAPIANVNEAPIGSVTIKGVLAQGQTLTVTNTLSDADGLGVISYQWQADGANISGANNPTLLLSQAQVGKVITVAAKYVDGNGTAESVLSSASSTVANVNDLPIGTVTIRGTTQIGQTLRAAGSIADADGIGSFSYQWKANGVSIIGATQEILTLTNEFVQSNNLIGKVFSVDVKYTDLGGANESVTSIATAVVLNADIPGPTVPSLLGHVYQWKSHTLLSTVELSVGQQVSVTNTDGNYQINPSSTGALSLSVAKDITSLETGNTINSADALAALKIAVGRSPNADGSPASPYQLIAADVNQDGKVTSADALAILKMAVKRADAPAREWVFVNESQDFWDESANNGQGGYTISRTNVTWNKDLQATVTQDTTVNLIAVLKGDVNGSWTGPTTGTQSLQTTYFSDLVKKGLGPLSTWGVVAA